MGNAEESLNTDPYGFEQSVLPRHRSSVKIQAQNPNSHDSNINVHLRYKSLHEVTGIGKMKSQMATPGLYLASNRHQHNDFRSAINSDKEEEDEDADEAECLLSRKATAMISSVAAKSMSRASLKERESSTNLKNKLKSLGHLPTMLWREHKRIESEINREMT